MWRQSLASDSNAGVMDHMTSFFIWNDLHWRLNKVELLQFTKEWNEELNNTAMTWV
jgi:hypothetical protein